MQYLILIYSDEKADASATKEEMDAWMGEYWAYTEAIQKSGAYKGGEALQPTATATTVRVKDGKKVTTHGPFAETKEQLGGYYLIDCKNLDEAIDWAAKCPGARVGSIEVRPIMDFSQAQ
ncbi:MAG: YciI family protein [Chloroflexi bacterium]|nr:YciI family protein [Chloroflexota bacterium]